MSRILLLCCILFITGTNKLFAQDAATIARVLKEIPKATPTELIYLYDTLCIAYKETDPRKAIHYAKKGYAAAMAVPDTSNQAYYLTLMGTFYKNMAQADSALYFFNQAIQTQELINFKIGIAGNYNNIATVHRISGNYPRSLEFYSRALTIMRDTFQNAEHSNTIYQNIAELMIENGKKDEAIRLLDDAEAYYKKQAKKTQLAHIAMSRARLLQTDSLDRAIYYARNAAAAYKEDNRLREYCQARIMEALLLIQQKKEAESTLVLDIVINESTKGSFLREKADALKTKTVLFLQTHNPNEAKANGQLAAAIYESLYNPAPLAETYKLLSEAEELLGNHLSANNYLKKADKISDSLNSISLKNEFNKLQIRYNVSEKERAISKLEENAAIQKNRTIFLSILAAVILLFAGIYLYRYNQKKKLSARLQAALNEREVLLKEVHHRVKNNLQLIDSFLNLQQNIGAQISVQNLVELTRNRVHTMSVLHEKLYKSANLSQISLAEYVDSLCDYYRQTYDLNSRQIKLASHISYDYPVIIDQLVPMGLILNEAITNSIKHAFDGKPGTITVTCYGDYQIINYIIEDNGKGFSIDDAAKSTLGLELVKGLANQLQAQLLVQHQAGTRFALTFKRKKA